MDHKKIKEERKEMFKKIKERKMYYYTPIVIDVISQKIDSATNKLVGIGGAICILSIVVGAICLMISKKIREEGKERLIFCVIGGVIIGMSTAIYGWITSI